MSVKNSINDIFSDLNSESSVILPKSIKIKNIKNIKNLEINSDTTSSFMPQKGGYFDSTSSFMPQKGGYLNANKNTVGDVNQLLSMLSDTSYDNYTTNSTDTEQLKNKLFNILQDGGSPTDSEQYTGGILTNLFNIFRKKNTVKAQKSTTYSLKDDTTLTLDNYPDKKSLETYLKDKVINFDILDFSYITSINSPKILFNINQLISNILVPALVLCNNKKELNLSLNDILEYQQKQIIDLFNCLKSLNLYHTNLFDTIVTNIATALETNTTLTELNISDNRISSDNATNISNALKINKTLTKLDLGGTRLQTIGAENIVQFLKTNKTLTSLNLSWNAIKDFNEIMHALESNTTLTELNLKENWITESDKEQIKKLKNTNPKLNIII